MRTVAAALATVIASASSHAAEPASRVEEVTYRYEEADATEFYRQVLDAMKITYRAETYEGKPVYWWRPGSKGEDAEVRGRVSQYLFATRACPKQYWPSPATPAGTIKRCER